MKRWKKTLKWTAIALGGLVAIGLVANAWFVWTTDTRLERQLAEIRAAGDPLTLADLARPPVPPEKNADTYLRAAQPEINAAEDIYYAKEVMDKGRGHNWEGPLFPELADAVKDAMTVRPKAFSLLEQAAQCPEFDPGLDYSVSPGEYIAVLLPVAQRLRGAARLLDLRTRLLVAEGNRDEAVRTGILNLRLARHNDRAPGLISYLVSVTIRGIAASGVNFALQSGPVAKDVRDELDSELSLHGTSETYAQALKSDRAFMLDLYKSTPYRSLWLYNRGYWNEQESGFLDLLGTLIRLADSSVSYREANAALKTLPKAALDAVTPGLAVPGENKTYPAGFAYQAFQTATSRGRAMIRCLRTLNGLQAHVPADSNAVPKLSDLGLPADATTDPFTGEPLKIKKTPRGWLVYSVGRNFNDDGGKIEDPINGDVGIGPPPEAKAAQK